VHLRLLNESISFYDKALSLNPSDPAVHFNRAYALHLMGREAEAIINASKAVALKRNYKEAFYLRGQCLLAMKEGSAACKDWVQAAKMGHKESKKALSRYCK
jgi:tetratricopeptide (TPR) repeat protein